MNILADLHHSGLFYSLKLLFEERLGFNLYRPIGTEWFENSYWDVARPYSNNIGTVNQYLSLRDIIPTDGSPILNNVTNQTPTYYEIKETEHNYIQKAITLEQFKEMDIDLIIASIPDHWITYKKLRDQYKPKAKLICQLGNVMWNDLVNEYGVENLLASVLPFNSNAKNAVFYHQELPTIKYEPPIKNINTIKSFVHLLPRPEVFNTYKDRLKDYEFKAYGASTPDGWINGLKNVYKEMQESTYGFHVKPHGDGMGHIWHSWFMVGRPVITNFSDYNDKLGGIFFEHKVTGIDLERGTVEENCKLIRTLDNEKLSVNARNRFFEVIDYGKEQKIIEEFLNRLI